MGAVNNYVMGIEEVIFGIPSLDVKIGECECLQEAQNFVVDKLPIAIVYATWSGLGTVSYTHLTLPTKA